MTDASSKGRASRRKGNTWENEVAKAFQNNGFRAASRLASPGEDRDLGDIGGVPGFTIECKNQKEFRIGLWLDQLRQAMGRGATRWGAVVVKRRMAGVRGAVVLMEYEVFMDLVWQVQQSRPGLVESARRDFQEDQ